LSVPSPLTTASLTAATQILAARDPDLFLIYKVHGTPPLWARRPGFPTLLRIILEQQVSLVSARAIFQRLKSNVQPFTPATFVELGESPLRSLGLTRQKAHYCVQLARAFADGNLRGVAKLNDADAHATLLRIKGVGPWTANIYLLMALRRPDIWPTGDIALASAVGKLRNMNTRPSFNQLVEIAEAWRPFRSVAARMLWQYYLARANESRK
jgi:DNA-3-methyladenine glycosylase II